MMLKYKKLSPTFYEFNTVLISIYLEINSCGLSKN